MSGTTDRPRKLDAKVTSETGQSLAAQVVADPLTASEITRDQAIAVIGLLAPALAAVQAQAVRPWTTPTAPRSKFDDRLTLTTAEVAEWTGLDETHVQELCRRGEIPATKPGKAWLIRPDAIREWLAVKNQERRGGTTIHEPAAPPPSSMARLDKLPRNRRRAS